MILDLEEAGEEIPGGSSSPSADYSPVVARLDMIADRVLAVRTAVQANYTEGHKEPNFEPIPRPETAIERERERRSLTVLGEVDALVTGGALED